MPLVEHASHITFQDPAWLFLLVLLPILTWQLFLQKGNSFLQIPSVEKTLFRQGFLVRALPWLPGLRVLAFTLLVLALARPQRSLQEQKIRAEGVEIMLVMDLSSSMLAKDFDPDRLEVSKEVAAEFVQKREFDRIGLAVFAGEAFTQCPLTTDHAVVRKFLEALQCGMLEDGTAIGTGLATAVNRVREGRAKSRVIILLTDGVNNTGYIQPITAARIAQKLGVRVYTIGVGSTGEALTPVRKRPDGTFDFGLAKVEIDEALLKEIARMTGGKFFRATSEEALARIYDEIDLLEKTEMEVTVFKRYHDLFGGLVVVALILLLAEWVLRQSLFRQIP